MNHIVRNSTLCGDDWCDAKKEIAELKAQVALLREALIALNSPTRQGRDDALALYEHALEKTK